ncbi:MAG: ATP-binding protein [Prevotella sp.]|nr:ATP-binding protein [Prevotella sp.]
MVFFKKDSYSIEDINNLIINEVEENIHLDYKAAGALDKDDKKRTEITKDISAFANSDGGIIVYGVSEEDHRPKEINPIDGRVYTKEWLENVILLIQPRIEEVKIYPIRVDDIGQSIYVVKTPRSSNAPHMARDKRYYKRFNFKSEPMEDYEVKDLYNRVSIPKLEITGCSFYKAEENENEIIYELMANVLNVGHQACESFKLNYYINNYRYCDIGNEVFGEKLIYTALNEHRIKFSRSSKETIYPEEEINMGCLQFFVKKENASKFMKGLVIDMILLYPGGSKDLAYIPSTKEFVSGREDINRILKKMNKEI